MAIARVEFCWDASAQQQRQVCTAITAVLVETLQVPENDPTVLAILRDGVVLTPGHADERFTITTITMFAGRSTATKNALYAGITRALGSCGIPPGDTLIVLDEAAVENWGVHGGQRADTVDLGFDVEI